MSRFGMWDPRKNEDYQFFDDLVSEQFELGGVGILVHKYIGVDGDGTDKTQPAYSKRKERNIQDMLFLENRDRNYDPHVYELYGAYNMQDTEFDVRQFGLFLEADTLYLEFHINDTIRTLGRKLMSGDVFEMPHLRDEALLDEDAPAINKFYVVQDVNKASGGYSPTWYPHIYRVKIKPLTDSQEFKQVLNREATDAYGDGMGFDLRSIISDFRDQIGISDAIKEAAESDVPFRNFETGHFYVVPGDEKGTQYPWIFAGDGRPPNGAIAAGSGPSFPDNPLEGDWFLKTDVNPHVLFRREGRVWRRQEVDYRKKWQAAHRILETFINNNNVTTVQDESFAEKQPLSKVIRPRTDL